ncbi:hypothetical protein DFJ73DRAFT_905594 [Zopfochytrium polystomum]|nr:hypothetical protein DFJ73DRAFT_905594 [Zopfochytrium polystomum]
MTLTHEITWRHAAHGLKLSIVAAAIVTSFLWAFAAIEVALVDAGSRNPPDSVCLYFALMSANYALYFLFARQVGSICATGSITVLPRDALFALIDLCMIVAPSLLARSRTDFFSVVSFAYFPVEFYVLERSDIQTAKGLFINAAVIALPFLCRSFGHFTTVIANEVFVHKAAEPLANLSQEENFDLTGKAAAVGASASEEGTVDDSDCGESPTSSDRAVSNDSFFWIFLGLDHTVRPAFRVIGGLAEAALVPCVSRCRGGRSRSARSVGKAEAELAAVRTSQADFSNAPPAEPPESLATQILQAILYADADPQRDYHVKAAGSVTEGHRGVRAAAGRGDGGVVGRAARGDAGN